MAVEKGAKTAVVWLLFTLPLSLLEGVFSQNGPQRSRARRCCAAKRTLHGEDRSEILDKRERGGPKRTAKMAQSLTASDRLGRPGGLRSVVAESVLMRHQVLILNRGRKRSPNLRASDRIIAGLCTLMMRRARVLRSAIVLKPSTLLHFHKMLTKQKYRLLFS